MGAVKASYSGSSSPSMNVAVLTSCVPIPRRSSSKAASEYSSRWRGRMHDDRVFVIAPRPGLPLRHANGRSTFVKKRRGNSTQGEKYHRGFEGDDGGNE